MVLPTGQTVGTDPLDFAVAPQSDLAVTLRLGRVPDRVTGHPGSRTTSYLLAGGHLHPGARGYLLMAEAIDLGLFVGR